MSNKTDTVRSFVWGNAIEILADRRGNALLLYRSNCQNRTFSLRVFPLFGLKRYNYRYFFFFLTKCYSFYKHNTCRIVCTFRLKCKIRVSKLINVLFSFFSRRPFFLSFFLVFGALCFVRYYWREKKKNNNNRPPRTYVYNSYDGTSARLRPSRIRRRRDKAKTSAVDRVPLCHATRPLFPGDFRPTRVFGLFRVMLCVAFGDERVVCSRALRRPIRSDEMRQTKTLWVSECKRQ